VEQLGQLSNARFVIEGFAHPFLGSIAEPSP
jgi:hypothetical protein